MRRASTNANSEITESPQKKNRKVAPSQLSGINQAVSKPHLGSGREFIFHTLSIGLRPNRLFLFIFFNIGIVFCCVVSE